MANLEPIFVSITRPAVLSITPRCFLLPPSVFSEHSVFRRSCRRGRHCVVPAERRFSSAIFPYLRFNFRFSLIYFWFIHIHWVRGCVWSIQFSSNCKFHLKLYVILVSKVVYGWNLEECLYRGEFLCNFSYFSVTAVYFISCRVWIVLRFFSCSFSYS